MYLIFGVKDKEQVAVLADTDSLGSAERAFEVAHAGYQIVKAEKTAIKYLACLKVV